MVSPTKNVHYTDFTDVQSQDITKYEPLKQNTPLDALQRG